MIFTVKKLSAITGKTGLFYILLSVLFSACSDDPNTTGIHLLPTSDLMTVSQITEKDNFRAFTFTDDTVRTDGGSFNLLGSLADPGFGKTTASMAFQTRLNMYPPYPANATPDSLVLYLLYKAVYGDTITPQQINVYELTTPLDVKARYNQRTDLFGMTDGQAIGELAFIPRQQLIYDTLFTGAVVVSDTVVQELAIKLDESLMNKLFYADSLNLINNDVFQEYFKGLYVEAEEVAVGGALVGVSTLANGSSLMLYYHTETDTAAFRYAVNSFSARVSSYQHDYSYAPFYANLNQATVVDSLIYLQTTGGLRSKIFLPSLDSWRDSVNYAINKAELVFTVDTLASNHKIFAPPQQIVLTAIDENGKEYLPSDFSLSTSYFGGVYNPADATYRFNITRHLQEVIAGPDSPGGKGNYGFYLSTAYRSERMQRVVLKGSSSAKGIRLQVTYTKHH